jgi:hypothetical protein
MRVVSLLRKVGLFVNFSAKQAIPATDETIQKKQSVQVIQLMLHGPSFVPQHIIVLGFSGPI